MQILTQYQQIHADTSTYLHSCPALQFQLEVCQCGVTWNSPGHFKFRASAYRIQVSYRSTARAAAGTRAAAVGALARARAALALKLASVTVHTGTVTMTAGTTADTDHQA